MKWGILATGTMTLEVEGKEPEIIRCPVRRCVWKCQTTRNAR